MLMSYLRCIDDFEWLCPVTVTNLYDTEVIWLKNKVWPLSCLGTYYFSVWIGVCILYIRFYNVPVFCLWCHRSSQLMTSQWLGGHMLQHDAVIGYKKMGSWMILSSTWSAARVLRDLYNSFISVLLQLCGWLHYNCFVLFLLQLWGPLYLKYCELLFNVGHWSNWHWGTLIDFNDRKWRISKMCSQTTLYCRQRSTKRFVLLITYFFMCAFIFYCDHVYFVLIANDSLNLSVLIVF